MRTEPAEIEKINKALKENFRVLDGRPIYRVAWSDSLLEKRRGNYKDYYGHIFIREYVAVREIKKYWYMNPPRWVLEKLVFIANRWELREVVDELVQAQNGTYEPLFGFYNEQTKQDLAVTQLFIDFTLQKLHNPTRVTPSDIKAMEMLEDRQEVQAFEAQLSENERSPLFVWDNSAFVSTEQLRFREEYVEKSPIIEGVEHGISIP